MALKQVKEISYAAVKDNEHLKIHSLENLMLCQSSYHLNNLSSD